MTDAQKKKEGRPGAPQPTPARPPQPVKGGGRAPIVARQVAEPGKPTPVRDLAAPGVSPGAFPEVEPDIDEATVEVDGTSWTIRVQGRSGGSDAMKPPLLLLGFWKAQTVASPPDREALVVGRLLADLTEDDLEAALAESRDPAVVDRSRGFFTEISERRRS